MKALSVTKMNPEVYCDYPMFATYRLRPPCGQGQQIPLPESEGSKKGQLGPGKKQLKHSREAACHFSLLSPSVSLFLFLPSSSPLLSFPLLRKEREG